MTTDNNISMHPFSAHLSKDEMLKYHRRQLSVEDNGRISKHLSECELCSDAMKGLAEMPDALNIYRITRDLHKRIFKRRTIRRNIFSRMDLISIVTLIFILGIILLLVYYLLIFKKG